MTTEERVIADGFGSVVSMCSRSDCGMQVVRPGKFQCAHEYGWGCEQELRDIESALDDSDHYLSGWLIEQVKNLIKGNRGMSKQLGCFGSHGVVLGEGPDGEVFSVSVDGDTFYRSGEELDDGPR